MDKEASPSSKFGREATVDTLNHSLNKPWPDQDFLINHIFAPDLLIPAASNNSPDISKA
jgi:hypothetical protein